MAGTGTSASRRFECWRWDAYYRNRFSQTWPGSGQPVVFWVADYLVGLLGREAPDFFDWRSDTLNPFVPALGSSIFLGTNPHGYDAHVLTMTLGYRFR